MVDIFMKPADASRFIALARAFSLTAAVLCSGFFSEQAMAQAPGPASCRIESRDFEGWHAQEMSNPWVKVTIAPQLRGRVMQVTFPGHASLFLNPKYNAQHTPPPSQPPNCPW